MNDKQVFHAEEAVIEEIASYLLPRRDFELPSVRVFERVYDAYWTEEPDEVRDIITQVLTAVAEEVATLPELRATNSRDFGRGYAMAIEDVRRLLREIGAAR